MTRRTTVLAACVAILSLAPTRSSRPADDPQRPAAPPPPVAPDAGLATALTPGNPEFDEALAAGLPRGSRPPVLGLERAYDLALIRARADRNEGRATTLDAKAVAELAEKYDVSDFARFRKDFLTGEGFRDPAAGFLDLLRRLHEVESAQRDVAARERILAVFVELAKGAASGVTRAEVDLVDSASQQARLDLQGREARYRDALDEFKVALGLSPHAPAVPARTLLAGFRDVADQLDFWARTEDRDSAAPAAILDRLPKPPDVAVEGRSVLGGVGQPERQEDLLQAAARVAARNRPDGGDRLELRVRRQVRRLQQLHGAYQAERLRLLLALRRKESILERIIAPPSSRDLARAAVAASEPSNQTLALIQSQKDILDSFDALVGHWADAQATRLALYRDLGVLPYDDWPSFYAAFAPAPAAPKKAR
jgi:hypothetical protein